MKADYEIYDFTFRDDLENRCFYHVEFRIRFQGFGFYEIVENTFVRSSNNRVKWFVRSYDFVEITDKELYNQLEYLHQKRISNETTI